MGHTCKKDLAAVRDAMLASAREVVAGHFCKGAICEWCEVLSKVCARIQALGGPVAGPGEGK